MVEVLVTPKDLIPIYSNRMPRDARLITRSVMAT